MRGRKGRGFEGFWRDIRFDYGIKQVIVIELMIMKGERKEEGYRGMKAKNIFCKSDKKFFA